MGIAYCVIALVCIAFGVGMTVRIVNDELRRQAENLSLARSLAADGTETDATITTLFVGLGHNVVGYEFTVDGRNYKRGAVIAEDHWKSLQVGEPIAIHYLPSNPNRSYPDSDPPNSQNNWSTTLPLAGMILLFMFGFATIYLLSVLPQRRLLSRGTAAHGIVTQCKAGSRGRSTGYFLSYDFSLPDGSKCQGKVFRSEPEEEGAAVPVLYDGDRPLRNRLYPMSLVGLSTT
jgi:hypothetical protein